MDNLKYEKYFKEYKPLITSLAHRYIPYIKTYFDFNDLFQEGCIGLYNAIKKHDSKKYNEVEFKKYALTRIKGSIIDAVKKTYNQSKTTIIVSFEQYNLNNDFNIKIADDGTDIKFNLIEIKEDIDAAISKLTKRESEIIKLNFYKDLSMTEISKKFKVTTSSVGESKTNALKKLKKELTYLIN